MWAWLNSRIYAYVCNTVITYTNAPKNKLPSWCNLSVLWTWSINFRVLQEPPMKRISTLTLGVAAFLLSSSAAVFAQSTTCQTYGNQTNCNSSNGTSSNSNTYGNQTNTTYSNGLTSNTQTYGNQTTTTYSNGKTRTCQTYGNQTTCN